MEAAPETRFEAMTTGMLLDRAFRLYCQNFALMMGITAGAYIPYYALTLVIEYFLKSGVSGRQTLLVLLYHLITLLLWATIALPIATGASTYAISERYLGKQVTTADALIIGIKRLITMSIAQLTASIRVFIGILLLIVPGILWSLSYALVVPVVLVEGSKALPSLRRSWDLVSGYRSKVFAVLIVVYILQGVMTFGLSGFATFVLSGNPGAGTVLPSALTSLGAIFITPYSIIAVILLYYDLRIRKEGFDLEMLSQSINANTDSMPTTQAANP